MSNKNSIIKSELLSSYKKGKSESEAHKEISKIHSSYEISLKTVNKWFDIFKSRVRYSDDYISTGSKKKIADEYLISLVKDNPKLNRKELARLANVSEMTILNRLKQMKDSSENENYRLKSRQKFTDEYLIDLVNKNPDFNMGELAKIAGTSAKTVSNRIRQINSDGIRVRYTNKKVQSNRVESWETNPKLEDEYLINLINNNPDLNMRKIAALTDCSESTISKRIKQINRHDVRVNYQKKNGKKFTDKFLVDLVSEYPDFNYEELAAFTDASDVLILKRLIQISRRGESSSYIPKKITPKFTDEYLIDLVNANPDLTMAELAKITGTSDVTISRRIKQVTSSGGKINYIKKNNQKSIAELYEKSKPEVKLTDECLIGLVNQNPSLNMKELAKLAGVSHTTISSRIKKINSNGERIKYIKKLPNSKSKVGDKSKSTLTDVLN